MYTYIHIYICVCVCVCVYIPEARKLDRRRGGLDQTCATKCGSNVCGAWFYMWCLVSCLLKHCNVIVLSTTATHAPEHATTTGTLCNVHSSALQHTATHCNAHVLVCTPQHALCTAPRKFSSNKRPNSQFQTLILSPKTAQALCAAPRKS